MAGHKQPRAVTPLSAAERPSHYGRKLVKDFAEAADTYAVKGSFHPAQFEAIEKKYASTRKNLESYIRKLEIKAEVPSSSKASTAVNAPKDFVPGEWYGRREAD